MTYARLDRAQQMRGRTVDYGHHPVSDGFDFEFDEGCQVPMICLGEDLRVLR